jgi:hypothetical protein
MMRRLRGTRTAGFCTWALAVVVVVLASRTLAYALAPGAPVLAARLDAAGGGPSPLLAALAVAGLSLAGSVVTLALVAAGVRERCQLELDRWARQAPPLRLRRAGADAVTIAVAAALLFAGLESLIHWRAGLGFHGLHCLVGPVHRDVLPLIAGFSILAASARAAVRLVLAALRRFVARRLARPAPGARRRVARAARQTPIAAGPHDSPRRTRAPPLLAHEPV